MTPEQRPEPADAQRRESADEPSVRDGDAVRPSELRTPHNRRGRVVDRVRHGLRALGGLRGR